MNFAFLPVASPSILAGFVNSLRGSFVILVYAEMYGAQYRLGFFVKKHTEYGIYGDGEAALSYGQSSRGAYGQQMDFANLAGRAPV